MVVREVISDNLKIRIRAALAKVGVEISAFNGSFAQHRMQLINTTKVSTVWDVGAHVGQYGSRLRDHGYRGRIISVEPSCKAFAELSRRAIQDSRWTVAELAVSDSRGSASLNLAANGQSSSLLPMKDRHVSADPRSRYTGTQVVELTTLDLLQKELGADAPHYVKLDLQGCELPALRGASEMLQATKACEIELSLQELYDGQSPWQDVVAFLSSAGFAICDFERVFFDPASGDLLQANALFRR